MKKILQQPAFVCVMFVMLFLFLLFLPIIVIASFSILLYLILSPFLFWAGVMIIRTCRDVLVWDYADRGTNNLTKSIELFIAQINATKNIIRIFDDGDYQAGGMYNDKSVMTALKDKIRKNDKFKIDIQFNSKPNENQIFSLAKKYKKNIKISYNPDFDLLKREEDEIHFRSSDDGELCHISRHKLGAVKRNYFSYEKPDYFDFCIPLTNWRPFSISEEKGENHPIFLSKNIFDKQKKTFKTI